MEFEEELQHLINKHSMENGSNTPDFLLAEYLNNCLNNWNVITQKRIQWFGKEELPIRYNPPK